MSSTWSEPRHHSIGGLTETGFDTASGLLLVLSHQGRGVFDPRTGEQLARDPDDTFEWFNERTMTAEGIGPLADHQVHVTGLRGGRSMPRTTDDGWSVRLLKEGLELHGPEGLALLLPHDEEVRAWGFSPDGRTVVLGTSPTLTLLPRL